ncbi:MAG: FAD-linked oxidase C-terminal domain-containing protein [Flavihumibacter sp.]
MITYASDAGFYQLIPKAVVQPVNEDEVKQLFTLSHQYNIPLVFRAGGTSLSGQCITDGILIDLSKFWNKLAIEERAARVRVQPGITGAMVNTYLKKHACKIGPDPSSISAAMMGGILSNNASGMCCGVRYNSYHTTRHIRFMLVSGKQYSTESPGDYTRFTEENPSLAGCLLAVKAEIENDPALYQRIRHKYQTKNTVGYSLNALIDYTHPLDIFAHLLIGGEGTLGFIAEAVLQTIPDFPCKATAMLYFADVFAACKAIEPLIAAGAEMVELMDRPSLRAVEDLPGMDPALKTLPPSAAALLIEFQEADPETLHRRVDQFLSGTEQYALLNPPVFTTDPAERELLWKMRKGMFPSVGAVRASGTTVILEDIAVPLPHLGDAVLDLQALFTRFGYENAIIFGHAKDGNLHFVVTQDFDAPGEVDRYDRFLREVVELVLKKYDGALKAEHGTGRNMAPFVETEWGGKAYEIMRRIKLAADPGNLLNPGVIIAPHADQHVRDLKPLPTVEKEVDICTECGFCEHRCPSRDLTLTPRRRIVVRRALAQYRKTNDKANYEKLLDEYQYDGLDTCAVDGLCGAACPVGINTGDLVKRLRREQHSATANKMALYAARHFGFLESAVRWGLAAGHWMNRLSGNRLMPALTKGMRKIIPAFPLWTNQLGRPPAVFRGRRTAWRPGIPGLFPHLYQPGNGRRRGE